MDDHRRPLPIVARNVRLARHSVAAPDTTLLLTEDRRIALDILHELREAGWRIVRTDPDDVHATFGNPGHRYHHIVDEWAPPGAVPAEGQEPTDGP